MEFYHYFPSVTIPVLTADHFVGPDEQQMSTNVKNSIPYSQFLSLRPLCSEDSDLEEMCDFFDKRGYPPPVVEAGHHGDQQIQWSAVSTTNVTEGKQWQNSIHPNISASQPRT